MRLACQRCKRKKIKCDKSIPVCHQCAATTSECQYVERRQRPRLAQQKVAVQHLNQRLELLEKHVATANSNGQRSSTASSATETPPEASAVSAIPSPSVAFSTTDDAQESWIYRMANVARQNFQITPIDSATPRIDNVMSSLNDALEDLGKLKLRADLSASKTNLQISTEESRQCIDVFMDLMNNMVVPEIFSGALDFNLLRTLPDIIGSPYINIAPGVQVMYYNALHYGLHQTRGPGDTLTQAAYLKALEAVPAWLDVPTETDMDGYTAALTAWAAINNLDYQLSWKFHCKSCHFIQTKGIDHLDRVPAKTIEEENKRESVRYLYWHVLSTDCLFRLFYGKPTVMRWAPNQVKPPAIMTSANLHPTATQVMTTVMWTRYTLMTVEIINLIDSQDPQHPDASIPQKVEHFCLGLESLMADFNLERHMKSADTPATTRCLLADHLMNIYAVIIGMKRLAPSPSGPVDTITLRAARKVVSTLLDFHADPALPSPAENVFVQYVMFFISFYPFCAVFSLYEYIIACTNPDDCEEDVQSLESIGRAMTRTCVLRPDFIPFAKTIDALNQVSRAIQDERRRSAAAARQGERQDGMLGTPQPGVPAFDFAAFSELASLPPGLGAGAGAEGEMDPLGFVRALENDFIARNWHEDWWDIGGELDGGPGMVG